MKIVNRLLLGLHLFVGIGALAGGLGAITNPQAPMGMSVEPLQYSPFSDYLIPGIILFTIIGLGNIIGAILIGIKFKYTGYSSNIFSWALVIWIVVQCIILNSVHVLHIIYFAIGLVQVILSMKLLMKQRLFPANIIMK